MIALTTRDDGGIVSQAQLQDVLEQSGTRVRAIVLPSHQHATQMYEVTSPFDIPKEIVADGLMTQEKMVVLAHRLADCCPLVVLDRRKRALCVLHAGWRGMTLGIVGLGILSLRAHYHSRLEDVWVWIGPCIQKESYISQSVPVQSQLLPWKKHIHVRENGFHVDLPGFAFEEAMRLGVHETHIINDGRDTFTESSLLFSHRRAIEQQDVTADQRFVVAAWLV